MTMTELRIGKTPSANASIEEDKGRNTLGLILTTISSIGEDKKQGNTFSSNLFLLLNLHFYIQTRQRCKVMNSFQSNIKNVQLHLCKEHPRLCWHKRCQ